LLWPGVRTRKRRLIAGAERALNPRPRGRCEAEFDHYQAEILARRLGDPALGTRPDKPVLLVGHAVLFYRRDRAPPAVVCVA